MLPLAAPCCTGRAEGSCSCSREPEAEKKWDEVLKPETIRLYHRYQDSLPKSGEVSVEDSIVNFLKNNYLWLFLNCPNLLAILLEK